MKYLNHTFIFLLFACSFQLNGQSLEAAQQLAEKGQLEAARLMLEELVQLSPEQSETWSQLGHICAWMGDQKNAIKHFQQALRLEETLLSAHIGLAYTYAWSRQFDRATRQFEHIRTLDPSSLDARKGLAYTALWRADYSTAEQAFDALIQQLGPTEEFLLSKGLAQLNQDQIRAAEVTFLQLLEMNPQHKEAQLLLDQLPSRPALLELDTWLGYTDQAGQNNALGLRNLQLALRLQGKWTALLFYDNSLSLDIASFRQERGLGQSLGLGVVRNWAQSSTELKLGNRQLLESRSQRFINFSQSWFLKGRHTVKGGLFGAFAADLPNEWMSYVQLGLALNSAVNLEPTYFFIVPPATGEREHRIQVGLSYHTPKGYQFRLGGLWGSSNQVESTNMSGWYASGVLPVSHWIWGQFLIRRENGFFQNFTTYAAGIKLRLQR